MKKISITLGLVLLFSGSLAAKAQEASKNLSAIAEKILDPNTSAPERDALITSNSNQSAQLIIALVKQIKVGTDDEYRGIPSIWRVAIAAGKRNQDAELKEILSVSLPKPNEPLRDWQAVVIGGGIINGLSLEGIWPRERIEKLLGKDSELKERWLRSIKLASSMADDEKVRHGTRYDALRMLGVAAWKNYGAQLTKYLGKDVNGELQQGAVSGLADVDAKEVANALIENFENLNERNRQFALDALLRNDSRIEQLLNAIADGKIKFSALGTERLKKLKASSDKKVRERVEELEKKS